ncbi:MAG: hypothetical protein WBA54_10260 [Acidaminobacteraceae bacterium]
MIAISVSELKEMVAELEKENIKVVELSFLKEQDIEGEIVPASLDFNGIDENGRGVDFGEIEEIE